MGDCRLVAEVAFWLGVGFGALVHFFVSIALWRKYSK